MRTFDLQKLNELPDVTLQQPNSNFQDISTISSTFELPLQHRNLLALSNGLSICAGYYRLLGHDTKCDRDLKTWNAPSHWKFAWQGRADSYFCFGTTAWGDQFAYGINDMSGEDRSPIYLLDAFSMEAEIIASDFSEFWSKEICRNAHSPYDSMVARCQKIIPQLDWHDLLAYSPPLQIGGPEDEANIVKMSARVVMIVNGDIATQLDALPDNTVITGATTIKDGTDLLRLKLLTD